LRETAVPSRVTTGHGIRDSRSDAGRIRRRSGCVPVNRSGVDDDSELIRVPGAPRGLESRAGILIDAQCPLVQG
jgi:hypothetical protein